MSNMTTDRASDRRAGADSSPILYACVSKGPTILADLDFSSDPDVSGDLRLLAARCLEAAPRFHIIYTRTTENRIYAFLFDDPLVFFAIADETIARPQLLLFLRRLRDSFASRRCRIDGGDRLLPLCLQDEFSPSIRQLALPASENPPPSPSSPPSDAPLTVGTPSLPEVGKRGGKAKAKRKKRDEEAASRVEIAVVAEFDEVDSEIRTAGRKCAERWWRRHFCTILLLDLIFCILLFAIWLSVCRGFRCIAS